MIPASLFIAVNSFGDGLDGTLARVRNRQRPRYGFYVDHVIDSFGAIFLCGGLALSGYMDPMVTMALLVAFLALSIGNLPGNLLPGQVPLSPLFSRTYGDSSTVGRGKCGIVVQTSGTLDGLDLPFVRFGGIIASIGMFLMLVVSSIRHTAVLYQEERLP